MKNRIDVQTSISTFGYLSKNKENIHSKREKDPHVHCSIIYNGQDTETI